MVTDLLDRLPDRLRARVVRRRAAARSHLFHAGDPAVAVYLLLSGRVVLRRVLEDGAAVTIHAVRPGSTFAEGALFADAYHCDAEAEAGSEVAVLPKADLVAALAADPSFAALMLAAMSGQMQAARTALALRTIRSAPERTLAFLGLRASGGVVPVEGSLKDMAEEIGLTPEAFYRTLAALERAGRIRRTGRSILLRT